MAKTLGTKLFLIFAALALFQTAVLTWAFSQLLQSDKNTQILENLSNLAQLEALRIAPELSKNIKSKKDFSKFSSPVLIDLNGEFLNSMTPGTFDPLEIKPLLAPHGTLVSPCRDKMGRTYFCAFSQIPLQKTFPVWVFESLPQSSASDIFWSVFKNILMYAAATFILSFFCIFGISKWLGRPLRKLARASEKVAAGNYDILGLPLDRTDEVGELAQSFQKMVTDLKDRERSLAMSAIKLAHSARLASIGQMGAGIAHEVKNPLMSMMGYAKILSAKSSTQPELKEAAEIILKESERCNQILQQMLRFARNDPEERKPYAMKEVIDSTLLLAKADAKTKGVHLKSENLAPDAIAVGSAQKIQQVLLNLILNAVQASSHGSEVLIRIKSDGGQIVLEVEDHGSGIPTSVQERIFDPFFTTKQKGEGTGLGLSIASEIVQNQGGSLSFRSQEGQGSVFLIKIPLAA